MFEPNIIYEDNDIAVVNKPSGLLTHSGIHTKEETLSDWFVKKYPASKKVGEPLVLPSGKKILRPGIVHRLDKETSGIIILVKTSKAYAYFKNQFQERKIKKTYRLFCYGPLFQKEGRIEKAIGKSKEDFRLRKAGIKATGQLRPTVTLFKTLSRNDQITYAEAFPQTGRTHQIRVHFSYIKHPIVHDDLYAKGRKSAFGFERLALHAYQLDFILPSGKPIHLEAPLPEDFVRAENLLNKE